MNALKYDTSKPAYDLIDAQFVREAQTYDLGNLSVANARLCLEVWADGGDSRSLYESFGYAAFLLCPSAPIYAIRDQLARVLAFGAAKYARHNWRKGMRWSRLIAAAHRHLAAFARGEIIDSETGLHHLGHFGCCLMFLAVYQREGLGTDDRDPSWAPPEETADVVAETMAAVEQERRVPRNYYCPGTDRRCTEDCSGDECKAPGCP